MPATASLVMLAVLVAAGDTFAASSSAPSTALLLVQNPSTALPDAPAQGRASSMPDGKRIIDHALRLEPETRQKLAQMLANSRGAGTSGTAADAPEGAGIGSALPSSVSLQDFPTTVLDQIPQLAAYKYAQMPDRILVVEPTSRIVVDEIGG